MSDRAFSSHLDCAEVLSDHHQVADVLILKLPVRFHIDAPSSRSRCPDAHGLSQHYCLADVSAPPLLRLNTELMSTTSHNDLRFILSAPLAVVSIMSCRHHDVLRDCLAASVCPLWSGKHPVQFTIRGSHISRQPSVTDCFSGTQNNHETSDFRLDAMAYIVSVGTRQRRYQNPTWRRRGVYMKDHRLPVGEPAVPILCSPDLCTMSFPLQTFHNRFFTVFIFNLATAAADKCGASSDLTRITACRPFSKTYRPAAALSISVHNRRVSLKPLRSKVNPPPFSKANFWFPWWAAVSTGYGFVPRAHLVRQNVNPRYLSPVDSIGNQRPVSPCLIRHSLLRKSWHSTKWTAAARQSHC